MSHLRIRTVHPTVFFVQEWDGLKQVVTLTIENTGAPVWVRVEIQAGSTRPQVELGLVEPGVSTLRVHVPDVQEPLPVTWILSVGEKEQDRKTVPWTPQRHWQVYIVPTSHHDLGYTDLPSNVLREHDGFMDEVLRFCADTEDWPEASRFRYTVEQAWSVLHFIEHRPKTVVEELIRYAKEGRIEVTALFGNQTSELCSSEELIRLIYPSFRLKREYGISIRSAELNDVPGLSWGLASVLAGAGIRYFSPGLPTYFRWGGQTVHSFWDDAAVLPHGEPDLFRWQGPDGADVLFWHGWMWSWPFWDYEEAYRDLPGRLVQLEQQGYAFDAVRCGFQGGHRDNSPPSLRCSFIAREWNRRWAYPRLIVATNADFFQHVEAMYGDSLRTLRGELPNTDYTVGATSTARETGINRITHDGLHAAEKLAAIASVATDYVYPLDTIREAYHQMMLYDEHTWGMGPPIGPAQEGTWSQKSGLAYRAAALSHDTLSKSSNKIADAIALPDDGLHIIVFNPLSWTRTDVVRTPLRSPPPCGRPMFLRYPKTDDGKPALVSGTALGRSIVDPPLDLLKRPFDLIDGDTGEPVPYQVVALNDPLSPTPYAAYRYALGQVNPAELKEIVFVAAEVPAMGYRTVRIVPGDKATSFSGDLQIGDTHMENRFFRVLLDPETGAVASLYDKEIEREFVDPDAPYGLNQWIARWAATGREERPTIADIGIGAMGPVYSSLIVRGHGMGCPQLTQEIILYDRIKRVDVANRVLKDATPLLEIYFAFPFKVDDPQFRFEGADAVIEPLQDQFPGSNSDAHAVQHWAEVFHEDVGVTWSSVEAPVVEFGGLWPGYVSQAHHGVTTPEFGHSFLRPGDLKKGHLYSYVMNNNFRTNFQPVQVGDALFRYSITTHPGDWRQGRARNFGWSAGNPLIPVCLNGRKEGTLPASFYSFCTVDASNVLLLTLKRAEDGDGLILRLIETEGQATTATVTLPFVRIAQAMQTNLVEENEHMLSAREHTVNVSVKAFGITTVRVQTEMGTARRAPTGRSHRFV